MKSSPVRLMLLLGLGVAAATPAANDGLLDPGFGYNGRSYLYWGYTTPAYDYANAMTVQNDGKVVLVGNVRTHEFGCNGNNTSIGISRLLPNGQFDTGFGASSTPGQTVIAAGGCLRDLDARAVALQSDGSIYIAGSVTHQLVYGGTRAAVWRLLPNGTLDTSYGGAGMATLPRAANLGPDDRANSIQVNDAQRPTIPLGVAVVAGSVSYGSNGNRDALAFVLDSNGNQTPGFGNWTDPDGTRYYRRHFVDAGIGGDSEIQAIDIAQLGDSFSTRFFAVGYLLANQQQPASVLYLIKTNFTPLSESIFTFNPSGQTLDTPSLATSLAIDRRAQRLWIGGTAASAAGDVNYMGVAAMTFDGAYDTSVVHGFGRDLIDFSSASRVGHARANGIALQRDGRVVLGGRFHWDSFSGDERMAAVRLYANGSIDPFFGDFNASLPGVQALQFPIGGSSAESAATGIAVTPHRNTIVLGGWTHNYAVPGSYYFAAAKLTDDTIFYDDFE